jgi:hypothetical protein
LALLLKQETLLLFCLRQLSPKPLRALRALRATEATELLRDRSDLFRR